APGWAVAGQNPRRTQVLELAERPQGLVRVVGERSGLRPLLPGEDVTGGQTVADEDGVDAGKVEGDAPRGMARQVDHSGITRDVESAGVRQRLHVGEVGGLQPSPAAGVPEEANEWADLHLAPIRLHLQLTGRPGGIGR